MTRVVAIILHALPDADAGPLESTFAAARAANAARQARGFEAAGAMSRIVETRPGGAPFGARLRRLAALDAGAGIVVLGSGSIPLATAADRRAFVAAAAASPASPAASPARAVPARTTDKTGKAGAIGKTATNGRTGAVSRGPSALTNNRFSSDILAIPADVSLDEIPDLTADNGVPRWLEQHGCEVRDLLGKWRLQVDLDTPIDLLVAGLAPGDDATFSRARDAAVRIRMRAADPASELLVAGRTSAAALDWLERHTASRTRALVEERGMRTAQGGQRPARSTLGMLLDRDGPESLGARLAELADAAVIDSRVLLAHRLGPDEAAWPRTEDRFASDLLLHEQVADPWLRALTRAAAEAPIPVLLGGHTLVGPGLRLLVGAAVR